MASLAGADIADEAKLGMIITFEVSAGKWADYRFAGTSVSSFLTPGAWEEYGGAGAVKVRELLPDGTLRRKPHEKKNKV